MQNHSQNEGLKMKYLVFLFTSDHRPLTDFLDKLPVKLNILWEILTIVIVNTGQ